MSPARLTVDDVFQSLDSYIAHQRNADPELRPPMVITLSEQQAALIETWAKERRQDKVRLGGRFKDRITHYRAIEVKVTGR